jgi:hypothetical protein
MNHESALEQAFSAPNAPAAKSQPPGWAGLWKTQKGSTVTLSASGDVLAGVDGALAAVPISGEIVSAKGGNVSVRSAQLAGFAAGNLVSFVALWSDGSQSVWTCRLVSVGQPSPRLEATWTLLTEFFDPKDQRTIGRPTLAGADELIRG